MTWRGDKEKTTMNSWISNITITLSCQFFAKISGMLILDVLDNRFPTNISFYQPSYNIKVIPLFLISDSIYIYIYILRRQKNHFIPIFVIHLITITRSIDNIKSQTNTMFFNYFRRWKKGVEVYIKSYYYFSVAFKNKKKNKIWKLTVRDIFNFGSLTGRFISVKTTFTINQMRCENGINKSWFTETWLTYIVQKKRR